MRKRMLHAIATHAWTDWHIEAIYRVKGGAMHWLLCMWRVNDERLDVSLLDPSDGGAAKYVAEWLRDTFDDHPCKVQYTGVSKAPWDTGLPRPVDVHAAAT